jgi:anti-sigma factor RsiW
MELSCQQIVELVTDYLDGALDPATAERVREHLELCDGCARYVEQLRITASALGELPSETIADGVRDELLSAFRDFRH